MPHNNHSGILIEVDPSGVGVIEETVTHNRFGFTLDKVEGYSGQKLVHSGLSPGVHVTFATGVGVNQAIVNKVTIKK